MKFIEDRTSNNLDIIKSTCSKYLNLALLVLETYGFDLSFKPVNCLSTRYHKMHKPCKFGEDTTSNNLDIVTKGTSSKNLNLLQKHVNRMLTPRVRPPSPPGQTLSWWAKHCNHTTGTCSYRASMQNACFHYQVVHNKNISYPQLTASRQTRELK